jgi:glycosyltransferase involved in cell wall biosynthesis
MANDGRSQGSAQGLRILHVELGGRIVGGPQQVIYLVDALNRHGVDNVLVALAGGPLATRFSEAGHRVHGLDWKGDTDLSLLPRLFAIIRRERPDVVHLHAGPGAALGGLAARLAGVPCVLSRRVDSVPRGRVSRFSYGMLYDRVVCISQAIFDVLVKRGVPRQRLQLIRSAVRASDWLAPAPRNAFLAEFGLPADAITIGVVAQLVERKGHRTLLEAAAAGLGTRAEMIFFGEGGLRNELEAEAARLGVAELVHFAGHRSDLGKWMGNLDLVVHPALMEGLGVALLQAAAAGVPVVASAVGGIPEAVLDGQTGLLVPPRDPAALGAAIRELLESPDLRAEMGQAARRRVLAEFDVSAMADRHVELYRELVARRRSR